MDRFFPTSWEGKMTKGHKLTLGLKGLSGVSNDVRELEKSADPKAAFALEYFVYRAGPLAGMLAAALSGLDAFVFTAVIGENSATRPHCRTARMARRGA